MRGSGRTDSRARRAPTQEGRGGAARLRGTRCSGNATGLSSRTAHTSLIVQGVGGRCARSTRAVRGTPATHSERGKQMDGCSLGQGRVPRVKSLSWQARGGWVRRACPGWAGENDARNRGQPGHRVLREGGWCAGYPLLSKMQRVMTRAIGVRPVTPLGINNPVSWRCPTLPAQADLVPSSPNARCSRLDKRRKGLL